MVAGEGVGIVVEPDGAQAECIAQIVVGRRAGRGLKEDIGGVAGNGRGVVDPVFGGAPVAVRGIGVGPGVGCGENRGAGEEREDRGDGCAVEEREARIEWSANQFTPSFL